jgi:hypothetical protein
MNINARPVAVLTTRRDPGAGPENAAQPPAPVAEPWPPGGLAATGTYAIFVHGFNDSFAFARVAYGEMRANLSSFRFGAEIIEFHWPGDIVALGTAVLGYMSDIAPSLASGALLANWIANTPETARFYLVSHSLGGRVVLNAVAGLRRANKTYKIAGVCMMAAAVPTSGIGPGKLGPLPGDPFRWRILYSRSDWVLGWVFPVGEMLAGAGFFPEAVGSNGGPPNTWTDTFSPSYTDSKGSHAYGHSNYWPGGPIENVPDDGVTRSTTPFVPSPPIISTFTGIHQSACLVANFLGAQAPNLLAANVIPNTGSAALHQLPSSQIAVHKLAA